MNEIIKGVFNEANKESDVDSGFDCRAERLRIRIHNGITYTAAAIYAAWTCGRLRLRQLGDIGYRLYFIPMGLNSRVERAYNNALDSVPGATALVDVTVKEDWMWWLIGTGRCVTVTGEAIK